MKTLCLYILCIMILTNPQILNAVEMTNEEIEILFNDDSELKALMVNEGKLVFLKPPVDRSQMYTDNVLTITNESINSGWVKLNQCHYNLDPVHKIDIVYTYIEIKNLKIESRENISRARVVDQSVQLEDVLSNSNICISAEARVFYLNTNDLFSLRNGPYYRKFLDGYYPYNVTMLINYPANQLKFRGSNPSAQEGFEIIQSKNRININAWFDGSLKTELWFERIN